MGFISAIFLLLVISSVNLSSIKLVDAATGDLVNYNNNFQTYTSPNDPNKDSAMQNADCVVNFMTSYVYTSSSAENCNNSGSSMGSSSSSPSMSPSTPSSQSQGLTSTDGPQTGMTDGSGVGVVRVVDTNPNAGSYTPAQSSSFVTNNSNPSDTNNMNVNVNDDNKDNDKDAKDSNNDDDNKDNDKDAKVYNENTVNKEERKLLLTTCFERAYDKGNYLSTGEIVDCANNYNS
ncbi:MAG TPA: hypothetical protein VJL78_05375 [Candidatus Nitrosocosmicus sp.]|nr:hypothetical protein [Candidatus Nitrosocosmicus sp.]